MSFQFTHPSILLLLAPALAWVFWLAWKTDVQIGRWRRIAALVVRVIITLALVLALAGVQWRIPREGVNVFFLLDRSESVPSAQQESAREWINRLAAAKKKTDQGGVVVFGSEAAIEQTANAVVNVPKIQAVVGQDRSDIGAAIRLGTAAFPESGQKRLVLFSDGNENLGDGMNAVLAARRLGATLDVVPLGVSRGNDVLVQKIALPSKVKKGQRFEVKIFAQADQPQSGTLRIFRNDQPLGEQKVNLTAGKNLFSFTETLEEPGFYSYSMQLEVPGDPLPQNNRASGFTTVQGVPRVLIVSADPAADETLASALRSSRLEARLVSSQQMPATLAELQSYDSVFLSNLAAGDLGTDLMKLLESAARDFGVGVVCIGGDQTYAAGSYRGTPLETLLPVEMELNSKKVLPSGAVALVMHGMEFMNGNQVARDCAIGCLEALGPRDEMGVVLWDGNSRWLFPMTKVGDKKELARKINGMNQGDLPNFQDVLALAHVGLKQSTANLKHIIVFSDGDPGAPTAKLMQEIVGDKITVSTVLIAGHAGPETMISIADQGRGRFYNVRSAAQLPQIFIKETAVILKSAIFEEPFKPQLAASTELVRGIGASEYPTLRGYVCTTPKPRAEVPLLSEKGDPILAHWQFGLGRTVAFTSDAKAKWAADWVGWGKYRQFWSQVAQWSLRKLESADFTTDVSIDKGEGHISVDAADDSGNYRNFLDLQMALVGPKGDQQMVRLEQTGPGHYEARFPTKEVGVYMMNLRDVKDGAVRAAQAIGASVNYSPEFLAAEPNTHLLHQLAEAGGGAVIDPVSENPFLKNRVRTYQPFDLFEWLLKLAIVLFPIDVGIRRVQLDREEWLKATRNLRRRIFFWRKEKPVTESDEGMAALLARRDQARSQTAKPAAEVRPELFQPRAPVTTPMEKPSGPTISLKPKEAPDSPEEPKVAPEQTSTTSRLLDAKRKARKKMD
jgi:Ca-activated chloride channel family protein